MPLGEVIMRIACPNCSDRVLVRSEPPCSRTTRFPPATHCAISRTMFDVATPAPPPILTTSVIISSFFSDLTHHPLNEGKHTKDLHRMQAGEGQPQRLVPTAHAVEGLDAIAGGALHQVIQCGDHHDAPLTGIILK